MIEFTVQKNSKHSAARIGLMKTPHGDVETPALVPVATQATVKALTGDHVLQTGSQMLIANTYHLHLRPGQRIVQKLGGLHRFMNWGRPLMTDSGGFQVFSLGFGRDLHIGKVAKYFPGKKSAIIRENTQPKLLRISDHGVLFRSPIEGREVFLGPKESVRIQEALGADILFAFDECTPPGATKAYIAGSVARTHRWANVCLDVHRTRQALFGIVQGGRFRDVREQGSGYIGSLPFAGFGIGGELGGDKDRMRDVIRWSLSGLPQQKPRHLLGIGHIEDIPNIIKLGIDTFDCIVPTHYARHGVAFTSAGKLLVARSKMLADKKPLDPRCSCDICGRYSRAYIAHLFKAKELTALSLVTFHNLHYFNAFVAGLREKIKNGKL